MRTLFIFALSFLSLTAFAQKPIVITDNQSYPDHTFSSGDSTNYLLRLQKNGQYKIQVMQKGVDVVVILSSPEGKKVMEKDSPNGQNGYEEFSYRAERAGNYTLTVKRLEEDGNPKNGKFNVFLKKYTARELATIERNQQELAPENRKTVQTLDIDHFWQAFDQLKTAKTHADSVNTLQTLYLDRATDGLLDFIKARGFTAEKFVASVSKMPKFYASVRQNTFEVKKAEPLIEALFARFKEIYPNFKPFKVCFAIGLVNTGGTVSDKFVLIGTEVSASTKAVDLSEFGNSAFGAVLAKDQDIVQSMKNIIAHECVHTQQKGSYAPGAVRCNLLMQALKEGPCDFIGELVAGSQINSVAAQYGDAHEAELWTAFKSELCNTTAQNWLYNYSTVKDKPADLGYYIGYKIAQEYYRNAKDKSQAIADIIEVDNPFRFLELSGYDAKVKK